MPFDGTTIVAAVVASGADEQLESQVDGLRAKLCVLAAIGRYIPLLNALANANNRVGDI